MEHVTFARFADRKQAAAGIRGIRQDIKSGSHITLHWGAADADTFEQIVQHSGDLAETDRRHALVVGVITGLGGGAALGGILAAISIFPGTLLQGVGFGALMGVLVGLLMMSILGAGLMDRQLQRLTRDLHAGEVVITVRTDDRNARDRVHQTLVETGAQVAEKAAG